MNRSSAPHVPGFGKLPLLALAVLSAGLLQAQDKPKYLDPGVPIEDRITDLLPRMTIEEKITQISDDWGSKDVPRLKIPPMLKTEGLHSQSYSTGATIFPHAIAMASTFDLGLVGEVGKQTAIETRAAFMRGSWSPVLDLARDVRWGRIEETYGESPYLVGRMGVAWIKGFQSDGGMFVVPKHFAGHGQPVGGRDSNDFGLSERTMRSFHLPPFREAIKEAGAKGIMAAYGVWTDGVPDNASTVLLQEILRQEWGFDGIVVSDCGGPEHFLQKHSIVETPAEAVAKAVIAGVSMECGSLYRSGALVEALEQGLITEAQVDELVRQSLRLKMRLGLFENPGPVNMVWQKLPEYDTPQARALALKVAEQGSVLLRNEGNLLPLKDVKTIAVIGPNADEVQIGDYSPHPSPGQLISVLQGIKNAAPAGTQVIFAKGLENQVSTDTSKIAEAVDAAKRADVAVVVVGDRSHKDSGNETTGENKDGATLDFPGAQRQLIKAIHETGKPVVLVIVNGKPFTLAWEAENIPAILVTWYPGQEGGNATANILFGKVNPAGRLPVTWPRHVGQVPIFHDYMTSGRRYDYYDMDPTPQYRFGYGLSYTSFTYSNLKATPKEGDSGFVTVRVDLENTGNREGEEVAQLYLTDVVASVATPVIELKGFERVSLKPGEKKTLAFELKPYDLSLLDPKMIRRVEPGVFNIHVGGVVPKMRDSNDEHKQKTKFEAPTEGVSGEFTVSQAYNAQFAYTLEAPKKVGSGQPFEVTVTVKNTGNLTDVTKVRLFAGTELDSRSFELAPGEEKSHTFTVEVFKSADLSLVAGSEILSRALTVEKSPARVALQNVRTKIDEDSLLQVSAVAQNVGGDTYKGELGLTIDGKPAGTKQALEFKPGEKRELVFSFPVTAGGLHKIAIGDLVEKQIVVPAGVALGLKNPLIFVSLDEGQGSTVTNTITGKPLKLIGTPQWTQGRNGGALELSAAGMGIDAENADIYRKAFTLSAWVKIQQFAEGGDAALFGGRAPMGADQDQSGTVLQVGVRNKKLFQGFFGRDISGDKEVPAEQWVNLTYTYDPVAMKGTLYLNGDKDKDDKQKPYTGPLEIIGDAPVIQHGVYTLDEAVVIQDCLASNMVKLMTEKGLNALREGEYVSEWRPMGQSVSSLDAVAEIPAGTAIKLTVETADASGKILSSKEVELKSGSQTYLLAGLQKADQIRLKARLSTQDWARVPVLRAANLGGQKWSSAKDWSRGKSSPALVTDYGHP